MKPVNESAKLHTSLSYTESSHQLLRNWAKTLALFELHLPPAELPVLTKEELWATLPIDPRDASQLERQLWTGIRRVSREGRDDDSQD
jgi:hypothetical protein